MIRTIALLIVLAAPIAVAAQGKLEAVRNAVDKSKSSDDACTEENQSDPAPGDSAGIFAAVPAVRFSTFPYARADGGYLEVDRAGGGEFGSRASVEVGNDFDGLTRVGLRLFLDTDAGYGLKTDWDYYSEKLDCGCRDELWIGDVTGTYRVVGWELLQVHVGLGARLLTDSDRVRGGVNGLIGFDAFPSQPLHVFGSFEGGNIQSAGVWRVRAGVGANWTYAELFAGYDYFNIGGVALQGPFVGLRLWY